MDFVNLKQDKKPKPEKKKSSKLLWIILAVVVVAVLVYFLLFSGGSSVLEEDGLGVNMDNVPTISFKALEQKVIDRFRSWSVVPVDVGNTGRNNPFAR